MGTCTDEVWSAQFGWLCTPFGHLGHLAHQKILQRRRQRAFQFSQSLVQMQLSLSHTF